MSVSIKPETLLSTSLLGSVANEVEESKELILEEVEHRLRELALQLIRRLERNYVLQPPRDGWDAVSRAEEAMRELVREAEVASLRSLISQIDIDSYTREQVELFAEYVDEVYDAVYGSQRTRDIARLEPALRTLTAVRILYFTALRDPQALWVAQKAAAILAAWKVLLKQKRFDIINQLPQVAREVLARYIASISLQDREEG